MWWFQHIFMMFAGLSEDIVGAGSIGRYEYGFSSAMFLKEISAILKIFQSGYRALVSGFLPHLGNELPFNSRNYALS